MTTTTTVRGLVPVRRVLDSGAVVIVQETSMTPAVTISASVRAGGVHEPADLPGLAYFTGRVLDRGTERRSGDAIADELDDRGVTLRVAASRHSTILNCTCLAEDFDQVLAIVLDVIRHPAFPAQEIEKRRTENIAALRQDDDSPATRAIQALFELLYGTSHPYGRRAKGTPASMESITRDDILAFHAARFHPSALTVAIVGEVGAEHAIARTALELDGWSGPELLEPALPPYPADRGRRVQTIGMEGKSQTDLAYGFVSIRRLDPRYYGYSVMNNILGQFGLGGRLADNIRERQGMAYYAFSVFDPSVAEGPLIVRAGVDPANVERALAAIDYEIEALGRDGPTEQELAQTKQYLIGSIPRNLETNGGIAAFLHSVEEFGLGLDYDRQLPTRLQAVTIEQVGEAARELLHPDRAAVAIAGPQP
jgi:zinc protease